MTCQDLPAILADRVGIPFAYHHWDRPPKMPYGVLFDDYTENFFADNIVYLTVNHVNIELYVRKRDYVLEKKLESVLAGEGLSWDKAAEYIDSERFYKISYEVEA